MSECYYRRVKVDGDVQVFDATDLTRSNWDLQIQHGSPPLALLTKTIENLAAGSGQRIGRVTLDILGAIPVARVQVQAWAERPGRRISMYVAEMRADDAEGRTRPVARVTAWLMATSDTGDVATDRYPPLREGAATALPPLFDDAPGYLDTVSWRKQAAKSAAARVFWVTPQAQVVDEEPDSPLIKLAAVVDSANGVGAVLDHRRFAYMNVDTVVHLHRLPIGENFALRARASLGLDGCGVTSGELFDHSGFFGVCAQSLLIQRRPD